MGEKDELLIVGSCAALIYKAFKFEKNSNNQYNIVHTETFDGQGSCWGFLKVTPTILGISQQFGGLEFIDI